MSAYIQYTNTEKMPILKTYKSIYGSLYYYIIKYGGKYAIAMESGISQIKDNITELETYFESQYPHIKEVK